MPDLKAVEIFGEGTWNGNKITESVLKDLVAGFEATKSFLKPVLKLGHNDEQSLLKQDGLPAAGWVENVYISGKKLLADFVDIPEKVYELIKKKAYRKVSVEIFCGYTFDGKTFPNLLGAVALLGADTPAVITLSDILGRYKLEAKNFAIDLGSNTIELKIFTKDLEEKEDSMSDKVTEKTQVNDDIEKKLSLFQKQFDEIKTENDRIKKDFDSYKSDSEKKISTLESQKTEAEIEKFALDLETKKLASPSMIPYIKALASVQRSDFSIGDKKVSTNDAIAELLKLAKSVYAINKTENTQDEKPKDSETDKDLEKKIQDYARDNKVSYGQAYREVMKK